MAEELAEINQQLLLQSVAKDKQAAELKAANEESESFSYSVVHGLQAPLCAINKLTQVLLEDYSSDFHDGAKSMLQEVIVNAEKMGELISNILEFSRIGKQHIAMTNIDVDQLFSL